MPADYVTDGDNGFIGLNSRDNPTSLPAGYLSQSVNMRLDRGIATTRKGLLKVSNAILLGKKVVGSGVYLDESGQEILVILATPVAPSVANTSLITFNPETSSFLLAANLPVRIESNEGVTITHAVNKIFITRGHFLRPLVWDMTLSAPVVLPTGGNNAPDGHQFPNCTSLMFYANRLVALGKHHASINVLENKHTVSISNFLAWNNWDALDSFAINQGGNDEAISLVPWTMNEFLVLMRNSSFYLNVGTTRYLTGDPLSSDSALYTLSSDVGCIAQKTAIQVSNGVMFLSDNGVYFLQPNPSGSAGVKLLTLGEPISSPINNYIKKINRKYAENSVAAYWENRYYLAVPLDDSTKNNAILVYNFILKSWESVDVYPNGIDFMNFWILKRDKQRRIYAVDENEGVLLLEESTADYIGPLTGTPILPFLLDESARLLTNAAPPTAITGEIVTRRYTFSDPKEKRFSSVEADIDCTPGGSIQISLITTNPDTETLIDSFTSSVAEDTTRRPTARKIAYGAQIKYKTLNQNPSIRSSHIKAKGLGKTNKNKI